MNRLYLIYRHMFSWCPLSVFWRIAILAWLISSGILAYGFYSIPAAMMTVGIVLEPWQVIAVSFSFFWTRTIFIFCALFLSDYICYGGASVTMKALTEFRKKILKWKRK